MEICVSNFEFVYQSFCFIYSFPTTTIDSANVEKLCLKIKLQFSNFYRKLLNLTVKTFEYFQRILSSVKKNDVFSKSILFLGHL